MNNMAFSDVRISAGRVIVRYQDKWAAKGHLINSGMVSPDKKYFYVNIPKNGSSFIKDQLTKLDWQFDSIEDYPDAIPLVVLRDPVSRWVSGIAEYLMLYHLDTLDANGYYCEEFGYKKLVGQSLLLDVLFKNVTFDDHTEKQIMFLQGVPNLSKVVWFKNDSNFSENFSDFLNSNGYNIDTDYAAVNDDSNYPRRKELKEFFKWYIETCPAWGDNINQYYRCDNELINKVKFYKKA